MTEEMRGKQVLSEAQALSDQLTEWRRDFHAHPELGFQEVRTSGRVTEELRAMGLNPRTQVGKTGVVAEIGEGSPVIGIRADMDALPLQEKNEVPYASQTPNVMHACGHDSHTAMLLGVARILSAMPDRPPGTIRLLFQPCEETDDGEKSGAQRMIDDGALEGVDRVIALHVGSDNRAGDLFIEDGPITANVDNFSAVIIGKGTHGAHPDLGIDPIFMMAQVINVIQGIRSRRIDPIRPAVVTIGTAHAGLGENVIPNEARISGTLRSYDDDTREKLIVELERALSITRVMGGDYTLHIIRGCPATVNDAGVAEVIRQTMRDVIGEDAIQNAPPSLGGEDFSWMTRKAPGAMFFLGAKKDEVSRPHHNPLFDLDESVFPTGSAILAESALRLLEQA
ncbi:MAG TPA: M20 family metallopeptidase [Candidatus Limnocylindrales bacterium]|nr:M20 family metallopeptidase [Candidatus Limnocylindrales bacterium]